MILKFDVRGEKLTCDKDLIITEGNKGSYEAQFYFDSAWDNYAKVCVFENEGESFPVAVIDDKAVLPIAEKISAKIGVIGVEVNEDGSISTRISTNMLAISVKDGAAQSSAIEKLNKEAQFWEIYIARLDARVKIVDEIIKEALDEIENEVSESLSEIRMSVLLTESAKEDAQQSAENAKASEEDAESYKNAAKNAADKAAVSESNAKKSEDSSAQAFSDLLSMINSGDIILATGGKLPLSSIPATATQEIYVVESENELTSLNAQRGDLAELVEKVNGENTITKTWQCLGNPTTRSNWVVWGTSYAVSAGNANHADYAENSARINGHRLVEMTEAEFNSAVKDDETYYLVY